MELGQGYLGNLSSSGRVIGGVGFGRLDQTGGGLFRLRAQIFKLLFQFALDRSASTMRLMRSSLTGLGARSIFAACRASQQAFALDDHADHLVHPVRPQAHQDTR